MPKPALAGARGIMLLCCLCMHVFVISVMYTDGFSPNLVVNSASHDKGELVRFGVKRSKVRVTA